MLSRADALPLVALIALALGACQESSSRPTQYPPQQPPPGYGYGQYPPGQYPPGQYPPGQAPPGQYPPGSYYPQQQPAAQQPPPQQQPAQPAPAPVANDPINADDIGWLRGRAQQMLGILVAALPAAQQQRVANIPLVVDSTPGDVNVFASCTTSGKPAMAVTDGLLDIEAHLADARATDELFGTQKTQAYIQLLAQRQQPNQPIVQPPPGFFDPGQQVDGRKVARQHVLFDEQVGFVLGHELGHHYLGHLSCTSSGGALSPSEIGQMLASAVPLFNQPNEFAADIAGTNNILSAGVAQGTHWTEEGGLLTMQFFAGLENLSPTDILFSFDRTHPPPQLRIPVIQQAANTWRLTGGRLPFPTL